jgi:hypothetical protein
MNIQNYCGVLSTTKGYLPVMKQRFRELRHFCNRIFFRNRGG